MSAVRKAEWLLLAATAGLMMWLKWLHYGVTHYNIFLLILIAWSLVLICVFRGLARREGSDPEGEKTGSGEE